MINYDLAKELKDAGFPQPGLYDEVSGYYIDEHGEFTGILNDGGIYAPTLEELIEACGEYFWNLKQMVGEWQAQTHLHGGYTEIGSTPTEAVARLFIALNKKV